MMILMLIAGIGCLLAGVLAIGFGIPVKEFSFGNTLIVTGVIGACAGLIILGVSAVLRELKNIAARLGSGLPSDRRRRERLFVEPRPIRRSFRRRRSGLAVDGTLIGTVARGRNGSGPRPQRSVGGA